MARPLSKSSAKTGVTIVISETTRAAVPELACRELDRARVKGRIQPVTLFEPLGPEAELTEALRQELAEYQQALAAYRDQGWTQAETRFQQLQTGHPEQPLYTLYLNRIAALRSDPPNAGWDGVFTFTEK